ncbi:hypothetical protein [Caulobacter sp. NIBR1757]|uniref:hypothetical protein n=1 Tax=Caulobacter sp. NIBR1757 TaxID=3016000 RepID=UPI0022F02D4C|nr:hypothetical protein [Caulobacter sp. NIBR1757]WGM37720.1 hypothetical protein AMEJIAPC_00620 [Caulobacter sp. NIBR1757]
MHNRAHVLRRGKRLAGPAFPAQPTLHFGQAWPGLALVLPAGAASPDLRPLRQAIDGLWRGPLAGGEAGEEVLVVTFVSPVRLEAATVPGALPLAAGHAGVLTSFAQATPGAEAAPPTAGPVRRVELWWGGRPRRVALEALPRLPLEDLWDPPRLHLHLPAAPRRTDVAPAPAGGAGKPPAEDGLMPVARSKVALATEPPPLSDAAMDSLARLEDRIKLSSIFRQMFLGDGRAGGLAGGRAGPWGQAPMPKGPSAWQNLGGWLRWHTPLGNPLRRSMTERMRLVEKLIASGDLDSALKLAMSLGGKTAEGLSKILPSGMWAARGSLDLNISPGGFAAPILGSGVFDSLEQRYRRLAGQLERDGDVRRAAFVYAQLLNDHVAAVNVLEKGGLLREAAKLAFDARLSPVRTISLLFKAGELDAALTLAKQAACFEALALDSKGSQPRYHAFVIKAWTDMLVASDQPLRALQVTDDLAEGMAADAALQQARRRWLAAALALRGEDPAGAELIVRGLLTADWTPEDVSPEGVEDFPDMARVAGSGALPGLLVELQAALAGPGEPDPQSLIDLLNAFSRLADEGRAEQAAFWARPGPILLEALARALTERAGDRLGPNELSTLGRLLDRAGQSVLSGDLRKLTRLHRAGGRRRQSWRLPAPDLRREAVRRACVLAGGEVLAWRESDLLQLFDHHGAPLWQGRLSQVIGLVSVGSSASALVLQDTGEGAVTLSRFVAGQRRLSSIGRLRLRAWHDVTSESQWLVQIGGDVGALDLAALCGPRPEVRFLWSSALTEQVRAIAFAHFATGANWITRDIGARPGVMESWSRSTAGEVQTSVLLPQGATAEEMTPPADWVWAPHGINRNGPGRGVITSLPWSIERERTAVAIARARASAGVTEQDRFQSCDLYRPFVRLAGLRGETGDGPDERITVIQASGGTQPLFSIEHAADAGLACLARAPSRSGAERDPARRGGVCLFADGHGRMIAVEPLSGNVVLI